jgi:hypothetical protein
MWLCDTLEECAATALAFVPLDEAPLWSLYEDVETRRNNLMPDSVSASELHIQEHMWNSRAELSMLISLACLLIVGWVHVGLPPGDDFQDGTTQGWTTGSANPNPPSWVSSGGPDGTGDGFLKIEGNGLPGSGGNLVAFNTEQWAGDYLASGVVGIRADVRNLDENPLVIRLRFEGREGSFLTASAANLPAGGDWQSVVWPAAAFSEGVNVAEVLSRVSKLRVLHAPTGDGAAPVEGVLGIDNVMALSGDSCLDATLGKEELALCHVYCEILECDRHPDPTRACAAIESNFSRRTGELPPCVFDRDGDGWLDELDNCPEDPNFDQSDLDGDGVGNLCDNCPDDPNPDQAGDVCECPCFARSEIADLIATLSDATTYQGLVCFDERPDVKPLTFISALRSDGAPCGSASEVCSALAAEFTEDNTCQYNPPAPAAQVLEGGIDERQRENCRALILDEAEAAGLACN